MEMRSQNAIFITIFPFLWLLNTRILEPLENKIVLPVCQIKLLLSLRSSFYFVVVVCLLLFVSLFLMVGWLERSPFSSEPLCPDRQTRKGEATKINKQIN